MVQLAFVGATRNTLNLMRAMKLARENLRRTKRSPCANACAAYPYRMPHNVLVNGGPARWS